MELHDLLDQVNDSQTFLRFARALMADCADSMDWENNTIEGFLESAIAWAESSDFGISQGLQPSNSWQQFAVFLYCGKIYE
ncbi:hypothetical protein QZH46_07060 [Pseudomonas corrugata]